MEITDGRRNSGLEGVWERLWRSKRVRIVTVIALVAAVAVFAVSIFAVLKSQQRKLDEIEIQKQQLTERMEELQREQERLRGNLEYIKSLEGLLQYARDNLGYIYPDDQRQEPNGD